MRSFFVLLFMFMSLGLFAQDNSITFEGSGVTFSGDNAVATEDKQVVALSGNVHFTTSIVEIEKADKIVYDRNTKTFTISGFKELRLNGKTKLASDLGETTLRIDLGDCVAYLVANTKACGDGKGSDC